MEKDFSVSMCVYGKDNPDWFRCAVESVLNQTVKPTEIVLVVDGPIPDELDEVIKKYEKREMFNVIRLEENQGHGNARRIGLENCQFDLVALMDADDISLAERFEKQLEVFFEKPEVSVVGGNISEFVDVETNIIGYRSVPQNEADIKDYMKERCPFNQMTVMFRKKDVQFVGGYKDWYCNEDYYLWIRMLLAGMNFTNVKDVLVNVRVGDDMYQRRGGWRYFKSEFDLQCYMLKHQVIGFPTYCVNVLKRFVVQVLLPNSVRGYLFKRFARTQKID